MYVKRVTAILLAALISVALVGGIAPQPAAAATVSIGVVSKVNAPDIKSKGIIRTPIVRTPGNTAVVSRSYTIYKGKKVVARTTSQNKAYKLARGTYTVKSTAKYRTFSDTDQYRTHTERYISGYEERQIEHNDLVQAGHQETQNLGVSKAGICHVENLRSTGSSYAVEFICPAVTNGKGQFTVGLPSSGNVQLTNGDVWSNTKYMDWYFGTGKNFKPYEAYAGDDSYIRLPNTTRSAWFNATHDVWIEDQYYTWTETVYDEVWDSYTWDEWIGTKRTYTGATKTITKTQTVKITNSATMTLYEYKKIKHKAKLSKVKSIVGGIGVVVDRWSWGSDDYVIRAFNGHAIYFKNGKVDSKYWNWC